jgi:HAD superfamily hydrolase (TIGR01544 family)
VIKTKADSLNQYYYPIEVAPNLTREEKIPHMIAWYNAINNLIVESKFTRADLEPSVEQANVMLRPGVDYIFDFAREYDVPLLIFSAGVGDVLKEVIEQQYGPLPPKSEIVSNWMKFDERGVIVGWTEPLIHMFNKDDSHLRGSALFPDIAARPNVLLIGDSLGDATMADGVPHALVLKVGFLNDNIDLHLANYLKAFDVVLPGDTTFEPVIEVLEGMAKAK